MILAFSSVIKKPKPIAGHVQAGLDSIQFDNACMHLRSGKTLAVQRDRESENNIVCCSFYGSANLTCLSF